MHFRMSSAICFNFDQSKILSSGNGWRFSLPCLTRDKYIMVSWSGVSVATVTDFGLNTTGFCATGHSSFVSILNQKRNFSYVSVQLQCYKKKLKMPNDLLIFRRMNMCLMKQILTWMKEFGWRNLLKAISTSMHRPVEFVFIFWNHSVWFYRFLWQYKKRLKKKNFFFSVFFICDMPRIQKKLRKRLNVPLACLMQPCVQLTENMFAANT